LSARPLWVEAGEPMPAGCDAVLEAEDLDEASPVPQITADVAPGTHVRAAAGEARSGQVLAEAGLMLTPATTGALAGCGIDVVMVRRPRVRLTMTGDIGAASRADAVAPTLGPLISSVGVDVVTGRRVGDDAAELTRSLRAPGADAIIMVGGTGFGRRDETLDAADAAGTVLVEGVMLAPGETAGFAMVENRPVLMLSARPDAALAGFLALGLPLLDALSGTIFRRRPSFGRLTRKVASRVGVAEIVFVRWREEEVEPLGGVEAPLSVLARAQGWLAVPAESEGWPQGERVEVHQL
jgi:molybdopterin biosynthesis enzyme